MAVRVNRLTSQCSLLAAGLSRSVVSKSSSVSLRAGQQMVAPPSFVTPTLVSWDYELEYVSVFFTVELFVNMTAVTAGDPCEIQWTLFDSVQGSSLLTSWSDPDQNSPHENVNGSGVPAEFRASGLTLKLKWRWRVDGGVASEWITLLGESISVPRPPP